MEESILDVNTSGNLEPQKERNGKSNPNPIGKSIMGLVQNLRKRLGRWVEKILVELSYHYIIQKAKQTSRKPNNSLHTEFLQSNLTTEHQSSIIVTSSQDTSEKITMELKTTEDIIAHVREWAIDKIEDAELCGEKIALYEEFGEWIDLDDVEELEIVSLEEDLEEEGG